MGSGRPHRYRLLAASAWAPSRRRSGLVSAFPTRPYPPSDGGRGGCVRACRSRASGPSCRLLPLLPLRARAVRMAGRRRRSPTRTSLSLRTTRRWTRRRPWAGGRCSILQKTSISNRTWGDEQQSPETMAIPFELFLPRPSLSTTLSAHCTERVEGAWAPRRRRIA